MATVNLGRIKPVFRGAYSGSTAYVVDDIVTSGGSSYICIQAHGAGTQAVSVTAYWSVLASTGTDVGATVTTQGDILFRDGSGLQRLAKGTAAQTLVMNSGATAPEWTTASAGGVLQVKHAHITGVETMTQGNSNIDITGSELSLTPSSTSNKILIMSSFQISGGNDVSASIRRKITSGGAYGDILQNTQRGGETLAHVSNTIRSDYEMSPHNIILLDAPNTTSEVFYKGICNNGPESGTTGYVNRAVSGSTSANQETVVSTMTIMEIASGVL